MLGKVIGGAVGLVLGFVVSIPLAGDALVALVYPHGGPRPGLLIIPILSLAGGAIGFGIGAAIDRDTKNKP
jgi:hypothetical protein